MLIEYGYLKLTYFKACSTENLITKSDISALGFKICSFSERVLYQVFEMSVIHGIFLDMRKTTMLERVLYSFYVPVPLHPPGLIGFMIKHKLHQQLDSAIILLLRWNAM